MHRKEDAAVTLPRETPPVSVCLQEHSPAPCTPALMTAETYQSMERFELLMHLGHPDMAIRYLAGRAILARFEDAEAILLRELAHPRWTVRQDEALSLLVGLQSRQAGVLLVPMLQHQDERRRLAAIKALRWLTDEADVFVNALGDPCWQVRLESLFALSDFGRPQDAHAFEVLLGDEHPRVRRAAQDALRRWKRRSPLRSLRHALAQQQDLDL